MRGMQVAFPRRRAVCDLSAPRTQRRRLCSETPLLKGQDALSGSAFVRGKLFEECRFLYSGRLRASFAVCSDKSNYSHSLRTKEEESLIILVPRKVLHELITKLNCRPLFTSTLRIHQTARVGGDRRSSSHRTTTNVSGDFLNRNEGPVRFEQGSADLTSRDWSQLEGFVSIELDLQQDTK